MKQELESQAGNNDLQLRTGPYKATFVGMEVVRKSTSDEWKNYGKILRQIDEAKQWIVGDWLVDGKRHYGDGLYKEASAILECSEGDLRNMKSLAERFQLSVRTDKLSWRHHYEVASMQIVLYMLREGMIALRADGNVISSKSMQIDGSDIVVSNRVHIQVKCDFDAGQKLLGGTGNLFIQESECNPFRFH